MSTPGLQVLRNLLFGVRDLFVDGVAVSLRSAVDFIGGPISSDDPITKRTRLDFSAISVEPSRRRAPVRCAAVGSLPQFSRVGNVITMTAVGALSQYVFDGVTPVAGDRVLLPTESVTWWGSAADAWIYTVTNAGGPAACAVLTRATDSDTSAKVYRGCAVRVQQGTTLAGHEFVLVTPCAVTLNTTLLLTEDTLDQQREYTFAATTTGGGVVVSIPMGDNEATSYRVHVGGLCTVGANAGSSWNGSFTFSFKRLAGAATIAVVGTPSMAAFKDAAFAALAATAVANVGTGCIDVTLPGLANHTIVYGGTISYGRSPQ